MAPDIATRDFITILPLLFVYGLSGTAHGAAPTEVIVNGVALKSEQVNFLQQQYSVRVLPGRYWYDAVSVFGESKAVRRVVRSIWDLH